MGTNQEQKLSTESDQRGRDLLEEHVYLNIVRARQQLSREIVNLCEQHGVTHRQYNVLRILYVRGQVPSSEVARHLIIRSPDVTRLFKRMEDKDLIDRELSREDRRVVLVGLTSKGTRTCERIDEELVSLHEQQLDHLDREELNRLNDLLIKLLETGEPA